MFYCVEIKMGGGVFVRERSLIISGEGSLIQLSETQSLENVRLEADHWRVSG